MRELERLQIDQWQTRPTENRLVLANRLMDIDSGQELRSTSGHAMGGSSGYCVVNALGSYSVI